MGLSLQVGLRLHLLKLRVYFNNCKTHFKMSELLLWIGNCRTFQIDIQTFARNILLNLYAIAFSRYPDNTNIFAYVLNVSSLRNTVFIAENAIDLIFWSFNDFIAFLSFTRSPPDGIIPLVKATSNLIVFGLVKLLLNKLAPLPSQFQCLFCKNDVETLILFSNICLVLLF